MLSALWRSASPLAKQLVARRASSSTRGRGKGKWRLLKWTVGTIAITTGAYYGWKYVKMATRRTFPGEKKRIVVLGTGWAALSLINHLEPDQFDVTIVSPRNYFLFSPLLPSVTVGTVESRSIVEPFRKLMQKKHKGTGMKFLEAECVDIEPGDKRVHCKDKSGIVGEVADVHLDYDILIVAVGSKTNTFRTPGVEEHAHFLKEVEDAQKIRNVIVDCAETASIPGQLDSEQKRLLHFVVVGGGPTGVEFAAEVRDFMREDVSKIYPEIVDNVKVTLVQSQDHILNNYDQQISRYTEESFKMENIDVVTNARVTSLSEKTLTILDKASKTTEVVPYGLCVWSTGVAPQPISKVLMGKIPQQAKGRAILTDKYLRVRGSEGIFALGDCSTIEHELMTEQAAELFAMADIDGDMGVTYDEFVALMEKAKSKYPQVQVQLSLAEKELQKFFALMDTSGDQRLDLQEFKATLLHLDRQLKSLPATAQVASQQGSFLGELLSQTNGEVLTQTTSELGKKGLAPFKYRHLGSFAYVGDNKAVLQVPIFGTLSGWWTMWLWRAAYASECASTRTKLLVLGDWSKAHVFGRDSSRI